MARLWNFPSETGELPGCIFARCSERAVNDYSSRNAEFSFPSGTNYSDANEQRAMHRAPSRMRASNAEGTDRPDKKVRRGGEGRERGADKVELLVVRYAIAPVHRMPRRCKTKMVPRDMKQQVQ